MQKIASIGTLLVLLVLVVLLSAHVLLVYPGGGAIDDFLTRAGAMLARLDAPSWVQAVGSIVAILASIGIVAWQRSIDRQQVEIDAHRLSEKQRALAIGLVEEISKFCTRNKKFFVMAAEWSVDSDGIKNLREAVQELRAPLLAAPLWEMLNPVLAIEINKVAIKTKFLIQQLEMNPKLAGYMAEMLQKYCEFAIEKLRKNEVLQNRNNRNLNDQTEISEFDAIR